MFLSLRKIQSFLSSHQSTMAQSSFMIILSMKDVIDVFHVSFDIDGLMDSLMNMTVLRTNQLLCFQR